MKKRILSLLLVALMIVSLLPTMAFATVSEGDVAQIGDDGYKTLAEAIEAVPDSTPATIKLLGDVTIAGALSSSKTFTIDLNGHNLTLNSGVTLTIAEGGNVTVKDSATKGVVTVDGTIKVNGTFDFYNLGFGTTGLAAGRAGGLVVGSTGCVIMSDAVGKYYSDVPFYSASNPSQSVAGGNPNFLRAEVGACVEYPVDYVLWPWTCTAERANPADPGDDWASWNIRGDGILQNYKGAGGHVVIPANVKELDIDWGNLGGSGADTPITSISFAEGSQLTTIENCKGLTSLQSITLPDSLTTIAINAFSGCTSLESVVVPSSVTSLGPSAFYNCTKLKNITFEGVPETINDWAFNGVNCDTLRLPADWPEKDQPEKKGDVYEYKQGKFTSVEYVVAKVGDNTYTTLNAALTAATAMTTMAEDPAVITLLTNVDLGNTALDVVAEGKTLVLDLGKNILTGRTNLKAGNLTIKNGTVAGGGKQALNVYGSDTDKANYSVLTVEKDVTVTADKFGICLFGKTYNTNGFGAVANVYGTVHTTGSGAEGAVFVSGNLGQDNAFVNTAESNNVITIYGKVTSDTDTALALNGLAVVNVEKGAELTGVTAVTVKRGTLNIKDGKIHSTGDKVDPVTANKNGTEMTGAAVSVSSAYNNYGPLAVNISGGEVKSDHYVAVLKYEAKEGNNDINFTHGALITISGGTFSTNPSAYVASGYSVRDDGNGTYTVYRPSSGGSSEPASKPVEIPAVGEGRNVVNVEATVSGNTATVKEISSSEISKVGTNAVSMDFSGLDKAVDEVKLPTASVETIAESASSGLEIKLSTGTVAFDAAAVEAISEAATGKDIALNVETIDKNELSSAQKNTVTGLGNAVIVKATLTSDGKTISGFGGGSAAVTVPYAKKDAKAVVAVYYLDDSGKLTKMNATYNAATKTVTFIAPHFSEYVLAEVTALPFVDVDESAYYADAVRWAAANGITSGVDATHFAPMAITTRGQMVTFLWRAAGCPEPIETTCAFTDVDVNQFYYKAVLWAVETGITKGTSDTTFSPDANVSRGQTVTFLARMSGVKDDASGYSHSFADVKTTDYYSNAVAWAATNKITDGTSATTFSPDDDCLRGQIVTFLYRNFIK